MTFINQLHMWIALLALAIFVGSVDVNGRVLRCDPIDPSDETVNAMVRFEATERQSVTTIDDMNYFPVVFHVFEDLDRGITVPDSAIVAQIAHANTAYGEPGKETLIRFELKSIYRYNDPDTAQNCLLRRSKVYSVTRNDTDALHVFICNAQRAGDIILGQAFPPCEIEPSVNAVFDGAIFLSYLSLRKVANYEPLPDYAEGDTFVHEMGHVFGLLHTFQSSSTCSGSGDTIADTPMEQSPNFDGCNLKRNTCPGQPGFDPVQNYMDYSPDSCMDRFTPMQISRMRSEIQRCLLDRAIPVTKTKKCTVAGNIGNAKKGAVCAKTTCLKSRMPSGKKPPGNTRWCRTTDGKWGGHCTCRQVFIPPNVTSSSPSAAPSMTATQLPTTHSNSPTPSTSRSPTTRMPSPTNHPSTSPTPSTPATDSPSVDPSTLSCSAIKGEMKCRADLRCRFAKVTKKVKRTLAKACNGDLGCRDRETFCTGLCPKICAAYPQHCSMSRDKKCGAKSP